jgi:hypothetical protein
MVLAATMQMIENAGKNQSDLGIFEMRDHRSGFIERDMVLMGQLTTA